MKTSTNLKNTLLSAIKTGLDGGFLYLFSGTAPATSGETLDMVAVHTQIAKLSLSGGATGLTFATPSAGVMLKTVAEQWEAVAAFSGFASGAGTLAPTFARFCASGDDGRTAGSGARLQFTAGGNGSGKEILLTASPYAPGAAVELKQFQIDLSDA